MRYLLAGLALCAVLCVGCRTDNAPEGAGKAGMTAASGVTVNQPSGPGTIRRQDLNPALSEKQKESILRRKNAE